MKELTGDPAYDMLEKKYPRLLMDYVLLGFDGNYQGESTHKRAAVAAVGVLNTRTRVGNSLKHPWFTVNEASMRCVKWDAEDFRALNEALFPAGRDGLEIYGWNDAFSNYFDGGKDWWRTAFWSIYDSRMRRFVLIGASLSD